MFKRVQKLCRLVIAVVCVTSVCNTPVFGRTQLKNICRIKGQEENTLRGWGVVIGLNGTGEANDGPTMRAVLRSMEIMGNSQATNGQQVGVEELRKMKNVSLVMVTATIPATGARRGDQLDCIVSAANGKSLLGGQLAFASLQGPNTKDSRVFALCQGPVAIDDESMPTGGIVHGGCRMEADVFTQFYRNGYITLVLDNDHANFQTAAQIAGEIDRKYRESLSYSNTAEANQERTDVRAIDATNIEVRIPEVYARDPVAFASEVLDTWIYEPEPEARVVINQRAGSIVISGQVEIGDVIITHKNVVIEAGTEANFGSISMDESNKPKLAALVDQLNALKVPAEDMIEIICGIKKNGKLHARLIVE
jgi:flagellar P-ring protein precursor FlgI